MKSRVLIAVAVVLAAAAGIYWMLSRRTPQPARTTATAPVVDAWLALRIQVHAAGPNDDVAVTVSAYDRRARQAAIVRDATAGRWRGSGPAAREPHPLPEGWVTRVRITAADGAAIPATVARPEANGDVVMRIASKDMPAGAVTIKAELTYDAGEAKSNVVPLARAALAPTDRLIALGRQAEVLADIDRLTAVGAELSAAAPRSPWGYYFAGAAHEARGAREAAVAAFRRALALTTPGYEPPIGLVETIRRLGG